MIYTAGTFGIDDTGMVKISWRTTSDMSKPQFDKPAAPNFTTVEASNGAKLEVWFDRLNIRPYANTLLDSCRPRLSARRRHADGTSRRPPAGLARLPPADQCRGARRAQDLDRRLRDLRILRVARAARVRSGGWAGSELEGDLALARAWPASRSASPSSPRTCGATRPADADQSFTLVASRPLRGLPERVAIKPGDGPRVIENLVAEHRRRYRAAADGRRRGDCPRQPAARGHGRAAAALLGRSARAERRNHRHGLGGKLFPLRPRSRRSSTWSATRATISRSPMRSGQKLNRLTAEFDEPGRFVCLPGYEWSGNTGMGGDRNIFFRREGRPIRRSSHILVEGQTSTDAIYTADELFRALAGEDAVVIAHVGGRYADLEICPRRAARTRRGGALDLGHVRVAAARCIREGLSRRRRVPQRRSQGPPRRHPARRLDLRRDRRPHLLFHARAHARCPVRGAAQAAPLRHDRHAAVPRSARHVRPAGDAGFPKTRSSAPAEEPRARSLDGRHRPAGRGADAACRRSHRHRAARTDRRAARQRRWCRRSARSRPPTSAAACACCGRARNIAAAAARRCGRASWRCRAIA